MGVWELLVNSLKVQIQLINHTLGEILNNVSRNLEYTRIFFKVKYDTWPDPKERAISKQMSKEIFVLHKVFFNLTE